MNPITLRGFGTSGIPRNISIGRLYLQNEAAPVGQHRHGGILDTTKCVSIIIWENEANPHPLGTIFADEDQFVAKYHELEEDSVQITGSSTRVAGDKVFLTFKYDGDDVEIYLKQPRYDLSMRVAKKTFHEGISLLYNW